MGLANDAAGTETAYLTCVQKVGLQKYNKKERGVLYEASPSCWPRLLTTRGLPLCSPQLKDRTPKQNFRLKLVTNSRVTHAGTQ